MSKEIVFGIGGWCEHCDESHNHPLHNIVEIVDLPDDEPLGGLLEGNNEIDEP